MIPIKFIEKLFTLGCILIFLTGCSGYQPELTSTSIPIPIPSPVVSVPATAVQVPATDAEATMLPSVTAATALIMDNVAQATPTAFWITGSVEIEGGGCCLGGTAGETVQAQVNFSAGSPFGEVSGMRIKTHGCYSEAEMETADWEPFVSSKIYAVAVPVNWSGFYVSVQFQDGNGNVSPIYCDDIRIEGSPPVPLVYPTDWFSQIRCFSEGDIHPGTGETVTGTNVVFSWPAWNNLPEGVYYRVFVYGAGDNFTGLVASAQTRTESVTLQIPPERSGDIVWYITLVDANGTLIDHSQCSSFTASLLNVNPPVDIKGVHFLYQP